MKNIEKISFLGLGVMGYHMAGHLAKNTNFTVTVYNRTEAKADKWLEEFEGLKATTPAEAAKDADLILLCVGNDDDLRAVLTDAGNGVITTVKSGAIIVDHTTVSAKIAREMYGVFAPQNVSFLDMPVSGGEAGAQNGKLTVMAGGDKDPFEHIEPLLRASYAHEIRLLGAVGSGQTAKMMNQICIAGTVQGLSEAIAFGQKAGLDIDDVLAVISKGAAGSWQMENRGKTMARDEFDFGFALDWMIKDLLIATEEGRDKGATLPLTDTVLEYYKELSTQGNGRCDTSALIKRLR